jgi:hypothetical protein
MDCDELREGWKELGEVLGRGSLDGRRRRKTGRWSSRVRVSSRSSRVKEIRRD